jgi:DNA-binding CsgD family transcriptional regulator
LLGLGDLARLRSDLDIARERYLAALTILTEVNARPEIARCHAGLGRLAIDQGDLPAARRHLAESLQLSYASGSRIGMARGLEALARLALLERSPQTGVRLAGAVTALRKQAQLPALPGARTQRFLDMAAELGGHVVARLWADGERMTPAAAVKLALGELAEDAADDPIAPSRQSAAAHVLASGLTAREREVVQLLADGKSNRAIAAELVISPATAARHVANILAKLGFSSRSQVAAWASSADAPH